MTQVMTWMVWVSIRSVLAVSLMGSVPGALQATDTGLSEETFQRLVNEAHTKFKDLHEGKNADYIPYLAKVDPNLFSVAIVTIGGQIYLAGDSDYVFPIESISKPFTMALVMQEQGGDTILKKIGVEPTGMPFNSVMAVELLKARSANPFVNAGAIASAVS